jgi:hypothetical protein
LVPDHCSPPEMKPLDQEGRERYNPYLVDTYSVGVLLAVILGGPGYNKSMAELQKKIPELRSFSPEVLHFAGIQQRLGPKPVINPGAGCPPREESFSYNYPHIPRPTSPNSLLMGGAESAPRDDRPRRGSVQHGPRLG